MKKVEAFIRSNLWKVLTLISALVATWQLLNYRVDRLEAKVEQCETESTEINERLIRLETKIDILLNNKK